MSLLKVTERRPILLLVKVWLYSDEEGTVAAIILTTRNRN